MMSEDVNMIHSGDHQAPAGSMGASNTGAVKEIPIDSLGPPQAPSDSDEEKKED